MVVNKKTVLAMYVNILWYSHIKHNTKIKSELTRKSWYDLGMILTWSWSLNNTELSLIYIICLFYGNNMVLYFGDNYIISLFYPK